ncbi:MAG: phosphatase PAP2 family protein [Dehalococcoidia bacterium]
MKVDEKITIFINNLNGENIILDSIFQIFASDYLTPVICALSIFSLWFLALDSKRLLNNQKIVFYSITAIFMTNFFVWIMNNLISRDRPFIGNSEEINLLFYAPTDPSFPANPVAIGFAVASSILPANKYLGYSVLFISVIFGFSRIYVGVFYFADVLVAALLGFIVAILVKKIFRTKIMNYLVMKQIKILRFLSLA